MKRIDTPIIITSLRAKVDGSIGFSASTPELDNDEKAEFFELQNVPLLASFEPEGFKVESIKIDKEAGQKTASQRLRSVLFVYWKQKGEHGEFEDFYNKKMQGLINLIKDKLI